MDKIQARNTVLKTITGRNWEDAMSLSYKAIHYNFVTLIGKRSRMLTAFYNTLKYHLQDLFQKPDRPRTIRTTVTVLVKYKVSFLHLHQPTSQKSLQSLTEFLHTAVAFSNSKSATLTNQSRYLFVQTATPHKVKKTFKTFLWDGVRISEITWEKR